MEAKEQKVRRSNALGPTGELVAANVVRLRSARGLSTTQLSKLLERIGRPIPPTGITKIEKRTRRVDVDDLMALAVALNVSPVTLLLPHDARVPVEVTGAGTVDGVAAWDWAFTQRPLAYPEGADHEERSRHRALFELGSRAVGLRREKPREGGDDGPSVD